MLRDLELSQHINGQITGFSSEKSWIAIVYYMDVGIFTKNERKDSLFDLWCFSTHVTVKMDLSEWGLLN